MKTKMKKLTHNLPLGETGYVLYVHKCKDNGNYRIFFDFGHEDESVWEFSEKMEFIRMSDYTRSELEDFIQDKIHGFKRSESLSYWSHHVEVYGREYETVLNLFDQICFVDSPMYPDEIHAHLCDVSSFNEFCQECRRRRIEKINVPDDFKGMFFEECYHEDRQVCSALWAARHSPETAKQCEPRFRKSK